MTKIIVTITGSEGFIGKNLILRLSSNKSIKINALTRSSIKSEVDNSLLASDVIVHLAGINRPKSPLEFADNADMTRDICQLLRTNRKSIPIIFSSSTQVLEQNDYGKSKLEAEFLLESYANEFNTKTHMLRLPNIFGKWCRPNYNSVVATFCHALLNNKPIHVNDRSTKLNLLYIDDLIDLLVSLILKPGMEFDNNDLGPIYKVTLGELASALRSFKELALDREVPSVGEGFLRALYATYISYKPSDEFVSSLNIHSDKRGYFAELLKTHNSGQFSVFTANPGVTRGGHYHDTKSEQFFVVQGTARFRFKSLETEEQKEICISSKQLCAVETIPGWSHDITNVGKSELIVLLWANEKFDVDKADTFMKEVN